MSQSPTRWNDGGVTTDSVLADIDGAPSIRATVMRLAEMKAEMRKHRAWWAAHDPVAYIWLCRAERRGAIVPWSEK